MTTKSRAAADKAARMADLQQFKEASGIVRGSAPPLEPAAPSAVKSKPVRVSLDLTPALYEDLTKWNREAAHRIGRTKVTNADTLRTLVRLMLDQPDVADEVIRRLRVDLHST